MTTTKSKAKKWTTTIQDILLQLFIVGVWIIAKYQKLTLRTIAMMRKLHNPV